MEDAAAPPLEHRDHVVFETADVGIALADLQGHLLDCNPAFERLLGYTLGEMRGRPVINYSHPDDLDQSWTLFRELVAGARDEYSLDKRYTRKDGVTVWVHLRVRLARDAAGRPQYAIGVVQDVGDRRIAEQARARLAAIVDSSQDAIVSKTLDGIVTSWNPASERLFGWTAEEMIGQSIQRLIPAERADEERLLLERVRRGDRIEHFETVRVHRIGRHLDVSLSISPVRDEQGRIVGASKIARDITAQKAAERVLRESEERYRSLVEASGAIVFDSDAEARWLGPQPAWQAYTGQTCEEYRDHGWADAIHPEDRERILALTAESVAHGTPFVAEGRLWHAPSKSWRYQEARAVPMRDEQGRVRAWVGTCTDVHARKEAEEALRASDRHKDEFLAVLAHELRNPLAPIANSLEILGAAGLDAGAIRKLAEIGRRQVRHLVRLVDDLMEVSRITRGAIELKREPLLLGTAVQAAIEISQSLIDEMEHTLEVALPREPLLVHGDRTRLTQVVANLLNNAAKYTPAGGTIRVTLARDGGHGVLTVADNGIGIPPDKLADVFEMFTQVGGSFERTQGGLGIGLSLVRRLVALHGGTVEARSAGKDRGSEFVVRLPLAAEVRAPAPAERKPIVAVPRRRVLVADDNRDAAQILSLLLRTLGQDVHTAFDGEEAIERAAALHPDLVLMNVGMPLLSGYEVARRIRSEAWGRDTLLVALTGWGQDQDRKRSRESGFDRHLIKPVNVQALEELLGMSRGACGGRVHQAT